MIGWTARFALACAAATIAAGASAKPAPIAPHAGVVIKMIDLAGGTFSMGTSSAEGQQGFPAHSVTIAPFRMAETDVTFDQYDPFARATSRALPQDEGRGRADRPVVNISWQDMHAFTAWLNTRTGHHYRLPSEAEWEYAARGGTTTQYYWGDVLTPDTVNVTGSKFKGSSPVKSFKPNPFGLYDMSGNVWQAVEDCLHPSYIGAPVDGSVWRDPACYAHIVRGGNYGSLRLGITVASRSAVGESFRSMGMGFRLAETISKSPQGK